MKYRHTWFYEAEGGLDRSHHQGRVSNAVFYNSLDEGIYVESSASKNNGSWSSWQYWKDTNPDGYPGFRETGNFERLKLERFGWLYIYAGFHRWSPTNVTWESHGLEFEDPDMLDILCEVLSP